ncbi:hypothetical protein B0H17DRAFT_1185109, partial [Mycena rosella]
MRGTRYIGRAAEVQTVERVQMFEGTRGRFCYRRNRRPSAVGTVVSIASESEVGEEEGSRQAREGVRGPGTQSVIDGKASDQNLCTKFGLRRPLTWSEVSRSFSLRILPTDRSDSATIKSLQAWIGTLGSAYNPRGPLCTWACSGALVGARSARSISVPARLLRRHPLHLQHHRHRAPHPELTAHVRQALERPCASPTSCAPATPRRPRCATWTSLTARARPTRHPARVVEVVFGTVEFGGACSSFDLTPRKTYSEQGASTRHGTRRACRGRSAGAFVEIPDLQHRTTADDGDEDDAGDSDELAPVQRLPVVTLQLWGSLLKASCSARARRVRWPCRGARRRQLRRRRAAAGARSRASAAPTRTARQLTHMDAGQPVAIVFDIAALRGRPSSAPTTTTACSSTRYRRRRGARASGRTTPPFARKTLPAEAWAPSARAAPAVAAPPARHGPPPGA